MEGRLAIPYLDVFASRYPAYIVQHGNYGVAVFVTVAQALDRTNLKKQSVLAVHDLLRQRLGETAYLDWRAGRLAIAGLKNQSYATNCELMRKFPVVHAEWCNVGPMPVSMK